MNLFTRHTMAALLLVTGSVGSASAAVATSPVMGVQADGHISTPCSSTGPGGVVCGPGTISLDSQNDSGVNIPAVSIATAGGGSSGQSSAEFDPTTGLPVLRAAASSGSNEGSFSGAEAVRKFTYTGPNGFNLTVSGNLHGTLSGPGASMGGSLALILDSEMDPFAIEDVYTFGGSLSGYFGEGVFPEDTDSNETALPGTQNLGLSVSSLMNTGDEFWVWASLGGFGVDGSSFDALSTGTYAFNTTNVAPAAVPLPAAVWLFGSGLLGMLYTSRRRA